MVRRLSAFTVLAFTLLAAACSGGPGATTVPTAAPSAAATTAPTVAPATAEATVGPASPAPSAATGDTVSLSDEGYFVGPDGLSLYTFDNDEPGTSNCEGECLVNWPALMVESEDDLTVGEGVDATHFSTITRSDGSLQVAFDDMPLYYFIGDTEPGQVNGDGVNDVWHLASDTGHHEPESTPDPDDYY